MVGTQELPGVVRLSGLVLREPQRGPSLNYQEFISKGHLLGDFSDFYDSLIEEQLCGSHGNVLLRSPAMRMSLMDGGPSRCTESITTFMPKATLPTDGSQPVSEYERKEVRQTTSCKVARIF